MKQTWKKIVCVLLAAVLVAGVVTVLAGCDEKVILVWGPNDHGEVYMEYLKEFAETHKEQLAGYKFQYAGSGDAGAYDAMAVDPRSGAGVYTFANDQMANLRNLGALAVINGDNLKWSEENNIAAAVDATKLSDGRSYAYPLQADNGYYMYYNKAAFRGTSVWDPAKKNVDGTNGDLKDGYTFRDLYAALDEQTSDEGYSKKVNWHDGVVTWPMGDSWYGSGIFFAVGGDYNVAYDKNGKQTNADAWFAYTVENSSQGFRDGDYTIGRNAFECFKNSITTSNDSLEINKHYLYTDGSGSPLNDYITYYSDVNDAANWGKTPLAAAVCGTWKAKELQAAWGDNYAATILPTLENDEGQHFAMKNFAGYKHLGVNPQCDFVTSAPQEEAAARLNLLHELAQYLCGPEISVARYKVTGAGPANKIALTNAEVAADAALLALNAQYDRVCVYPDGYTGYEYTFESTENTDGTITYTRSRKEVHGGDPVGNGLGYRTQDSVPANYWTPIQNFANVLYQEIKAGKLDNFSEDKIEAYLAQLQSDIQAAAQ